MHRVSNSMWNCLHEVLDARAEEMPDKVAIRYLPRGEVSEPEETLTFKQLKVQALATAKQLLSQQGTQERVLLIYDSGFEFAVGFWACVYAGMVAVPLPMPKLKSNLASLKNVVADATPGILLCSGSLRNRFKDNLSHHSELSELRIMCNSIETDLANSHQVAMQHNIEPDHLVFLQYTSGSTGSPKGVMVSHQNLLANQKAMRGVWHNTASSVIVSWLPYYHDMGLIGTFIQSTFCGAGLVMFPPVAFAQNPMRWLEIIHHYRGTNTGAPNFAYQNCVDAASNTDISHLDLSCWEVAWNGAEPVHAKTLHDFIKAYESQGFNPMASTPSYGLAEATLTVASADETLPVALQSVSLTGLEPGTRLTGSEFKLTEMHTDAFGDSQKWAVSCGRCVDEHQLLIVDPNTSAVCHPFEIGEIWFSGPSVAKGYWNKPELSEQTFRAVPLAKGVPMDSPCLRTGDLGYVNSEGDLYVVGRCKDMMIIRGENHAPQDVEFTVANCHPALMSDGCAAFSVIEQGQEKLVVVQEVKRTSRKSMDTTHLLQLIRQQISQRHSLSLSALILINQSHLPKTTSGKVQRRLCKTLYLQNEWKTLFSWNPIEPDAEQWLESGMSFQNKQLGKVEVQHSEDSFEKPVEDSFEDKVLVWLRNWLETELLLTQDEFDPEQQFAAYGMDSQMTARMMFALEQFTHLKLDPTLCWNYPSPACLNNYLREMATGESA